MFARAKIGSKLVVSYISLAIIVSIVGSIGIVNLNRLNTMIGGLYSESLLSAGELTLLRAAIDNSIRYTGEHISSYDPNERSALESAKVDEGIRFDEALSRLSSRVFSATGQNHIRELQQRWERFREADQKALASSQEGNSENALTIYIDEMKPLFSAVNETLDGLRQFNNASGEEAFGESTSLFAESFIVMTTLVALSVIIAIVIGLAMSRAIGRPMQDLSAYAVSIARGEIVGLEKLQSKTNDEIGILVQAFNTMTESLSRTVFDIRISLEHIGRAMEQVSQTSQSLSEKATEQAASLEEISSTVDQMANGINSNAQSAAETENIARACADIAKGSGNAVSQTLAAMKVIVDKISIVTDIASRTNLLSLNASIEAARAGEMGKGFTVVATEVRTLAANSQTAAAEINELTKNSLSVSENANKMLSELVPTIQKTAFLVQAIAESSDHQNRSAEQINQAIQQLNMVTQNTAAASEELASVAKDSEDQLRKLKESLSFFREAESVAPVRRQRQPALIGEEVGIV